MTDDDDFDVENIWILAFYSYFIIIIIIIIIIIAFIISNNNTKFLKSILHGSTV